MIDLYPHSSADDQLSTVEAIEHEKRMALDDELQAIPEQIKSRVEDAVKNCEFEDSPEIEAAIANYYADHYKAATIAHHIIEGYTVDGGVLANEEAMLESFELTEALGLIIAETDRRTQLNRLSSLVGTKLFAEAAVGQTTIGEQELGMVLELNSQLQEKAREEGIFIGQPFTRERIQEKREYATQLFWKDSRAAGQLEFHNTPFADELALTGFKLRTKSNQAAATGSYNSVTADAKAHSQSIHFSETYLSDSYKGIQAGKQVNQVTIGGTVAVPLAEIVKQLPYARGGEYGIARLKTNAENSPTIIDDANIFAFKGWHVAGGADDEPTARGEDRTFYADKYDRQKGEDYALDFGSAMKSPQGNVSHVLFLQRDIDIAYRKQYMKNAGNVDGRTNFGSGEGYPNVEVLDYDYGAPSLLEPGVAMEEGKMFIDEQYHKHSANGLGLVDPRLERVATEHASYRHGVTPEQQEQELRRAIKEMQRKSRELPQYKGKLVVMLRGGTMAYRPAA